MNAATLLTLIACAIEAVMGMLALAFAAAQGWRHFRTFALVAFSAAAYGMGDTVFASAAPPGGLVLLAARWNLAIGCLHCATWVAYIRRQYAEPLRPVDRWLMGVLGVTGLLGLIPGWAVTTPVVPQTIEWAEVTYHIPTVTRLGTAVMLAVPLSVVVCAYSYIRKARQN